MVYVCNGSVCEDWVSYGLGCSLIILYVCLYIKLVC